MIALSVLDQSPVPAGSSVVQALGDTVALAQATEALGYRRYWLAEHHNTAGLAGVAPEVLSACVAARTTSIRVGAGGVLLPYYRPLKVAEAFRSLTALFGERIDLGLGRTPGADEAAAAALAHGSGRPEEAEEGYPDRVGELLGLLDDEPQAVRALPGAPCPQVWVLGSSSFGAALAGRLGLAFSFAHFVSPRYGPQLVASYRGRFRPSPRCPEPLTSVGVSVLCADTDAEAQRLAVSDDVWHLRPEGAGRGLVPTVEQAQAYRPSGLEQALMAQRRDHRLVGTPEVVQDGLVALARAYATSELVVRTVCWDPKARLRSYELLAEAFELEPAA